MQSGKSFQISQMKTWGQMQQHAQTMPQLDEVAFASHAPDHRQVPELEPQQVVHMIAEKQMKLTKQAHPATTTPLSASDRIAQGIAAMTALTAPMTAGKSRLSTPAGCCLRN